VHFLVIEVIITKIHGATHIKVENEVKRLAYRDNLTTINIQNSE
jgi:hypothetical protein